MTPKNQADFMLSEYNKILSPHVQVSYGLSKLLAIKEAENIRDTLKYHLHKKEQSPILYWEEVINQLNKQTNEKQKVSTNIK